MNGTLEDVVNFIINVNTSFRTGYIQSATLSIGDPPQPELDADALTQGSIQMIIYSYTRGE